MESDSRKLKLGSTSRTRLSAWRPRAWSTSCDKVKFMWGVQPEGERGVRPGGGGESLVGVGVPQQRRWQTCTWLHKAVPAFCHARPENQSCFSCGSFLLFTIGGNFLGVALSCRWHSWFRSCNVVRSILSSISRSRFLLQLFFFPDVFCLQLPQLNTENLLHFVSCCFLQEAFELPNITSQLKFTNRLVLEKEALLTNLQLILQKLPFYLF